MQSIIALSVSLLALSASAAPTTRASTVQVQFANDISGANANAWIPLDGSAVSLGAAYANTELVVNGALPVTSLEFTGNFANVACKVVKEATGTTVASLADPETDFMSFSRTPLNWETGFDISCWVA